MSDDDDQRVTDDEKIQRVKGFLSLWLPPRLLATLDYLEAIRAAAWQVEDYGFDMVTFNEANQGPTSYIMTRLEAGDGPERTPAEWVRHGISRDEQPVRLLDGTPWTIDGGVHSSLHEISDLLQATVADYQQRNISQILSGPPKRRRWRS